AMTTIAAMEMQLRELQEKAEFSASSLKNLVAHGEEIESGILSKRSLRPLVAELRTEADNLAGRLKDSSNIVQQVVESVRILDTAQANTRKALERTVDIVGLKTCVDDVATAMVNENWELAATSIQRYLHVEPEDSKTEEAALQSLKRSLEELRQIVRQRSQAATESNDQQGVVRFCKLMGQVGLIEEGISRLTQFLARRVEAGAQEQILQLKNVLALGATGGNVALFAKCLTSILDVVARATTEGEQVVKESFGDQARSQLVTALYTKAAPSIAEVLELIFSRRNIASLVRKYRDQQQLEKKVALELDVLLEEISLCLQRIEQFNWFMVAKARAPPPSSHGDKQVRPHVDDHFELPRVTIVEVKKAELISGYIALEETFMRYSVEKAIKSRERDDETLVSALVDEVFFVLKKCSRRALATSSLNAMGDVIMYAHSMLVTTYKEALEAMLAATDRSGGMQLSGGLANLLAGTTIFDGTCYNNLEVSANNIRKLHHQLEAEIKQVYRGAMRKEEDKARECMSELATAGHILAKSLSDAIERLAALLDRFLSPAINLLQSTDYETQEAVFCESAAVVELISTLESTLQPFRMELNSSCFDMLVLAIVSQHVVPPLERLVLGKKPSSFSAMGAMQFDKDLRALTGFCSTLTQRTVRDQFTRLSQLGLVLNLGEPKEIFDYGWGDTSGGASVMWRLTADEVRKAMMRRSDFRRERIQALKL
ncbi:component of oligomeric golgi complex 4, partial [Guillardia theta CCMP2712]